MMNSANQKIIAIIDNVIRLKRDTLGPDLLSHLRNSLTRENPAYWAMKRMKDKNPYRMANMVLPPATISSYEEDDSTFYVPRGFKKQLITIIDSFSRTIQWHDETVHFERDSGMCLRENITLKQYQRSSLGRMILNGGGVLVAPCGAGKTVIGVAIISTLKQPTLILVHTNDLLIQWRRELAEKSILPGGLGVYCGTEKQRGQAIVATIQSIVRLQPSQLRQWLAQFGCIILDEAHHCPADTFMSVVNMSSSKYRFGLTATPERKDGLSFLLYDVIGPIAAEITDYDLQNEGRSQSCSVRYQTTSFFSRKTVDQWTSLITDLINDKERNSLIISQVKKDFMDGHFPLVISERSAHCKVLVELLRKEGVSAQLLIGEIDKGIRSRIIEEARNNHIDVIVATKIADEGLDIPQLSCLHMVTPTSNQAKVQQRVGRIRRPIEGKKSLVVDYQDVRVPGLLRMSTDRKRLFKRWGFDQEC